LIGGCVVWVNHGLTGVRVVVVVVVVSLMVLLMVARVTLVFGPCRPAELHRQQSKHEDGKPTAH
jgi:hypothetical protein